MKILCYNPNTEEPRLPEPLEGSASVEDPTFEWRRDIQHIEVTRDEGEMILYTSDWYVVLTAKELDDIIAQVG